MCCEPLTAPQQDVRPAAVPPKVGPWSRQPQRTRSRKLAGEQAIGRVIERALVLPDNLMCDADGHKHRALVELVLRKRRGGRNEPRRIARKRGNGQCLAEPVEISLFLMRNCSLGLSPSASRNSLTRVFQMLSARRCVHTPSKRSKPERSSAAVEQSSSAGLPCLGV